MTDSTPTQPANIRCVFKNGFMVDLLCERPLITFQALQQARKAAVLAKALSQSYSDFIAEDGVMTERKQTVPTILDPGELMVVLLLPPLSHLEVARVDKAFKQ